MPRVGLSRASVLISILIPILIPGCQQPNAAFDELETRTDAGTDGSGDGDGDTGQVETAEGDGDTGNEAPDLPDLPPDSCSVPLSPPLEPTFLDPTKLEGAECPLDAEALVKIFDMQDGNWMVGLCEGTCYTCNPDQLHPLGAPGLALAELLPPLPPNGDAFNNCYFVEAEELVVQEANRCVYSTLSVFSAANQWPVAPRFAACRDDWGFSLSSLLTLGLWIPGLVDKDSCGCDLLDQNNPDLSCCNAVELAVYNLEVGANEPVMPGASTMISIAGHIYEFHGVQAQTGQACDVPYEVSWAIVTGG